MITKEQFKTLKQISISKDPEKSKVRILEVFKNSNRKEKDEIKDLTGFTNFNNYYNAGKSGVASPKVVVSLALVLDVSPRYLTGEIDDKKSCTAEEIAEIYAAYGAGAKKGRGAKAAAKPAAKSAPKSAKPAPKAKPAKAAKPAKPAKPAKAPKAPAAKPVAKAAPAAKPKAEVRKRTKAPVAAKPAPTVAAPKAAAKPVTVAKSVAMEYDVLAKLLESLSIRAKYNSGAADTFTQVKELLLK